MYIKHVATLIMMISSINNKRMGITQGSITTAGFLQQWLTKPCFKAKRKEIQ